MVVVLEVLRLDVTSELDLEVVLLVVIRELGFEAVACKICPTCKLYQFTLGLYD